MSLCGLGMYRFCFVGGERKWSRNTLNNTFENYQVFYDKSFLLATKTLKYKLIFEEKFKLPFVLGFHFCGAFLWSMDQ